MANVKALPERVRLLEALKYDPIKGTLIWKTRAITGSRTKQWNAARAGKEAFTAADRRGYKHGKIDGVKYQAHRVIWKMVTGEDPETIDHINRNPSDNRWGNLRNCTNAENSRNYVKAGNFSSKYRGVCWVKRDQKWAASISVSGQGKLSLGHYLNELDAALAYDEAAKKFHGDFAILNSPQADYERRILDALE